MWDRKEKEGGRSDPIMAMRRKCVVWMGSLFRGTIVLCLLSSLRSSADRWLFIIMVVVTLMHCGLVSMSILIHSEICWHCVIVSGAREKVYL